MEEQPGSSVLVLWESHTDFATTGASDGLALSACRSENLKLVGFAGKPGRAGDHGQAAQLP